MSQLVRLCFRQLTVGFGLAAGMAGLLSRRLNGLVLAVIPADWIARALGEAGRQDHKAHLPEYRPIPVRVDDRPRRPF